MSAKDEWEARRVQIRDAYLVKWGGGREPRDDAERDQQVRDFQRYMENSKVSWRQFYAEDPDEANKLFTDNLFKISALSTHK